MNLSAAEKYIVLLLFERRIGGQSIGFSEEIHVLEAEQQAQAEALAEGRGREQEVCYLNCDGDRYEYRLLRVVTVQPYLFGNESQALLTRSFNDLNAYREVATLRGPC